MKQRTKVLAIATLLLLATQLLVAAWPPERSYEEGTVWQLIFIRTKPGMFDTYIENLNSNLRRELEVAVEKGFLVDYKIMQKWPAYPGDWDILIMEGYPNMAALDNFLEKWDEVDRAVFEALGERDEIILDLNSVRTMVGRVISRELAFKSSGSD